MKRNALTIIVAIAVLTLLNAPAWATLVEIQWSEPDASNFDADKALAIEKGKAKAVLETALALLPEPLDPARQTLLENELAEVTDRFVQTYAEVSLSQTPDGWLLFLDVAVNEQALSDWLRTMGLSQSAAAAVPYDLMVVGAGDEVWEEIGRLQALTRVTPQAGATPRLTLELLGTIWNGHMETGGGMFSEQNEDLATLWHTLWGRYFADNPRGTLATGPEAAGMDGSAGAVSASGDILQVTGWYSPDGVYAFDQELAQWTGEVAGAQLMDVTMRSTGLTARWRLGTVNRQALETRMQTYAAGHGLQFTLQTR